MYANKHATVSVVSKPTRCDATITQHKNRLEVHQAVLGRTGVAQIFAESCSDCSSSLQILPLFMIQDIQASLQLPHLWKVVQSSSCWGKTSQGNTAISNSGEQKRLIYIWCAKKESWSPNLSSNFGRNIYGESASCGRLEMLTFIFCCAAPAILGLDTFGSTLFSRTPSERGMFDAEHLRNFERVRSWGLKEILIP